MINDLFGILVNASVNVINIVILKNIQIIQTASAGKDWLIN